MSVVVVAAAVEGFPSPSPPSDCSCSSGEVWRDHSSLCLLVSHYAGKGEDNNQYEYFSLNKSGAVAVTSDTFILQTVPATVLLPRTLASYLGSIQFQY